MTVHLQIAGQINRHIQAQTQFKKLEVQREEAIEKALQEAASSKSFSVTEINTITEKMNALAREFYFPMRKLVTNEMVISYLKTKAQ